MSLVLHNSLTGKKEPFEPLDPNRVTMYVCGPTVYNYIHLGNGRSATVFDLLYRVLKELYPTVEFARNFTDVDDKINAAAAELNAEISVITDKYIAAYDEDMAALGNLEPTLKPKATEHIGDIISTIEALIERGHAYASEGHVLFAVDSMADYGKLSKRNIDDMIAGARVEVASYKKNPMDFVLWKPSTDDLPGWDSPWGRGRPGWHIECTAMIQKHLGETIDIHGGGSDLLFPHHENELAQGTCCSDHSGGYAKYWVHNAMLDIEGEKMSKSLGNFIVLRDMLAEQPHELVRVALLSAHYRSNMNWSEQLIHQSRSLLDRIYTIKRDSADIAATPVENFIELPFAQMLLDDLNTPKAFAVLHELTNQFFKAENAEQQAKLKGEIEAICNFLNIAQLEPNAWFQGQVSEGDISAEEVEALIEERKQAKKNKDFARADAIREELAARGVQIKDTREGTLWSREG
ncbi:cysteine--tRNA ligase [Reinekea marinisedimentorum]|uniref:Cysteine--tRNA ligase n=1 Tax=Reinekea marinisedimentorum TaxID=230495 RepID=A0A4R3I689_9GAMM|nr:cysteine--tRNA ligase [Reinekea marinisedimentorum]TCS41585.1 cysteinyl-tRNA synthetase [Reinekea marinisedimentorum]